jgi:hypothetical protein
MIERIKAFWKGLFIREVPSVPVPPVIEIEPVPFTEDSYLRILNSDKLKPTTKFMCKCWWCGEEIVDEVDYITHCYNVHSKRILPR